MIGKISSISCIQLGSLLLNANCPSIFSVRAKLRNADPGYNYASSMFLRCLYEKEDGDPDSPEVGFLKGPLLLRVRLSLLRLLYH